MKGLYLILDPDVAGHHTLHDVALMALDVGVRLFQVRVKTVETRKLYDVAAALCPIIHARGGRLFVNDRCDVALAVDADGVHLGQDDLPLAEARAVMGPDKWIGISTHSVMQAAVAEAGGADYVGFGPLYPTTTKRNPDAVVGLEGLREVRAKVRLPIVAIGGITSTNIKDVMAAGADAPAVLSAILAANDPAAALRALCDAIVRPAHTQRT